MAKVVWNKDQEPREVMDVRQAAAYLGMSTDTLYKHANAKTVPAFKLGGRWKFKRVVLDFWIQKQMEGGNGVSN